VPQIAAPQQEAPVAIEDEVPDTSEPKSVKDSRVSKSLGVSMRPIIEGVVSLKPAFDYEYCQGCPKAFMGEVRYAALSPARLALFHSFEEAKTGTCPAEVICSSRCRSFKLMKDLMQCEDPVESVTICFTPAQPSKFDAWLAAMVEAGFGEPENIPSPGMSGWKGEADEPIIHKGWLDFEIKGSRVSGYTLLLPDRLASWSSQEQATSGELPEGCVNLKDIIGVETISNGFVLNKGIQKVVALVDDPVQLRAWAAAVFLAIASPQGQAGMSWKASGEQPWRDAALRPRQAPNGQGRGPAPGCGKQLRKANSGKGEGRTQGSALDTESNLALRPRKFRDELRATSVIMCQRLKAAAFTCQGMDWKGLLRDLSKESSGMLTWEDFLHMCRKTIKLLDDEEHLQACFRILDADDSGVVDVEELILFIADPLKTLQKKEQLDAIEAEAGLAVRSPKLRGILLDILMKTAARMKAGGHKDVKQLVVRRSKNIKTLAWDEFLALCRKDFGMDDRESMLRCVFRSLDTALLEQVEVEDVVAFVSDPVSRIHARLKKAGATWGLTRCDGKGWEELLKTQARGKSCMEWVDFRIMCRKKLRMMDDDAHLWLVYRTLKAEEQASVSLPDLLTFMATGNPPKEPEKPKPEPPPFVPRRSQIGDRVSVSGRVGTVRFIGCTHFAKGDWLGIELDGAEGKNDGTVDKRRYFRCEDNHGIFVRPPLAKLINVEDQRSEGEDKETVQEEVSPEPPAPTPPEVPSSESVAKDFEALAAAGAGFAQEQLVVALSMGEQKRRVPVARSCIGKESLRLPRSDMPSDARALPITLSVSNELDGPELELLLRSSNDSQDVVSQGSYKVNLGKLTPARWISSRKSLCRQGRDQLLELEYSIYYEPVRARRAGSMPISITVKSARGLQASSDHYCVVTAAPGSKTFRLQTDCAPGQDPLWDHEVRVEEFGADDQLIFAVWRRVPQSWDKLIGEAVLASEKIKAGFDGEVGLSSTTGGELVRLRVSAKAIVLPGESVKTGLLHMHIGDVFLNSQPKQTGPARSPSPSTRTVAERGGTKRDMRINTGRQEAALQIQGPHAAFMLPPGERCTKGGYHVKEFPVSDKVSESQELGQSMWGKFAVGRLLTPRPGDSTEGVASKVNVDEKGRAIGSNDRGRQTDPVHWAPPTKNPTHGSGGFYSARGCSEPPASMKANKIAETYAASMSPRGVLDITSKVQDRGPTIYRSAACAR